MRVFTIGLDFTLPPDPLLDLFLFQWHSPPPLEAGGPGKLPPEFSARRAEFLRGFGQWLRDDYCQANPDRPVFLLMPELSVSLDHIDLLKELVSSMDRPAFVVAGLDFLTWEEYRTLINSLEDMPERETWLANGDDEHRINSAFIAVRDANGNTRSFLQPKRNPSDAEGATHFPCQNALLFQSTTRTQGVRLNYCVQICADFTSATAVSDLRKACEVEAASSPLDFTFVLQRNEDQQAPQFKKCIGAYFATPNQMADTSPGCLVFVNNANESHGKSAVWGQSMLLFPYDRRRWRTWGSPTYWLSDNRADNYQAAIVREPGPSLYWLRYKPHYLVSPVAGSGQPGPFADNYARCLELHDQQFPTAVQFEPIPAVTHWLLCEWEEGRPAFSTEIRDGGGLPEPLLRHAEAAYDEALTAWRSALASNDTPARNALALYLACFPGRILGKGALEPQSWEEEIGRAARRFLEVYSVLHAGLPTDTLRPDPCASSHADLFNAKSVTLLWGGHSKLASAMITTARQILAESAYPKHLVNVFVLVEPKDDPGPETLASLAKESARDITQAGSGEENTAAGPDITTAGEPIALTLLCDQRVFGALTAAPSIDELTAQVAQLCELEIS